MTERGKTEMIMSRFRNPALFLTIIVLIAAKDMHIDAQQASSGSQSASIVISIALDKDHFQVGQSPWVIVTMNNRTDRDLYLHGNWDQLHIEGENGEPPTTLRQRMTTGKLRRGEAPLRGDENAETVISTEKPLIIKFDVKYLYDLSAPGKYTVYVDVKDPLSGKLLRTNTEKFEIKPPAQ